VSLRDIYSELIKAQGQHAQFDVGAGDISLIENENSEPTANRRRVVSLFSKAIKVDKSGKAKVEFDIPDYQGKLKIAAVAWSKNGAGSANSEVVVKDPVSTEIYMPKFLSKNDSAKSLIEVKFDKELPKGEYNFKIRTNSVIDIEPKEFTFNSSSGAIFKKSITIKALDSGESNITVTALKDGKEVAKREFKLATRAPFVKSYARVFGVLDSGVILDTKSAISSTNWVDVEAINLELSSTPLLGTKSIKKELIAYCCRCAEQTTSRAFAMLNDKEQRDLINSAIDRLYELQKYDGGFGLWSGSKASVWVTSYATDFLTRAKANGFNISQERIDKALKYLEHSLKKWTLNSDIVEADSYALYVLAKNNHPLLSEIYYHINNHLPAF